MRRDQDPSKTVRYAHQEALHASIFARPTPRNMKDQNPAYKGRYDVPILGHRVLIIFKLVVS